MRLMGSHRECFLRFLLFLRNLTWRLLDIGGWLEQAKDNHPQSKSSNRLPFSAPLNGITELFDKPLLLWGEKPWCAGDPVSHPPRV
jgi:hypothetical protein